MKIFMTLIISCLVGSLLIAQSGINNNGQTYNRVNKEFRFQNESSTQEVNFEVGMDCKEIRFKCNGEISSGHLNILFIDPNGKKEGGFTLEAQDRSSGTNSNSNSNSDEQSNSYVFVFTGNGKSRGNMHKNISAPIAGTWVVRIKTDKVSGKAEVNLNQTST